MSKILYRKKKIGDSYLIWFQNTHLFFHLEEPAWYVFKNIVKGYKKESIAKEFTNRYSLNYDDSLKFVTEIRQKTDEMNKDYGDTSYFESNVNDINTYLYTINSTYLYDMFKKTIKFTYEYQWLENFIHPLITHLKTTDKSDFNSHFELFTYNNRIFLRVDKTIKGSWEEDESEYVKGRIFIEMLNVIHDKTDEDWMMTVHASAISNGRKTILFSAAPGSGKTTFAALLQANGYYLISDDFVPIEQSTFKAFPLPIAMSVKEGSLNLLKDLYPNLENSPLININSKKKVRFLPVDNKIIKMEFPVNEIVFIKYDKSVNFHLEKIEPVEGLKRLLNEAWIPASPSNIEIFLDKILKVSFYSLNYSDNQKALKEIDQFFKND
jgi:hypothetical protein